MALPKIEKRIRKGTPLVGKPPYGQVHAHSTGNRASTAQNEVDYFQTKPMAGGTFTHIVGNGRIIQVAPVNRGNWDVGGGFNSWGYAAVELIESHKSKAEFMKDYKIYVELLRKLAKDGGVKIKVDSGNLGILSHNYCTYHQPNNKSDHVDPYPYLAKWGISKAQFKKDVEGGKVKGDGGAKPDKWAKKYYTSAPDQIKAKIDIGVYAGNDVDFNNRLSKRKKGTVIPIKGIKRAKNGLPRFVTSKGNLITANKSYVEEVKTAKKSPAKPRRIAEDGQWGNDCTKRLQEYFGTKPIDGIISGQIKTSANTNVYSAQWGTSGSNVIRAIQKQLGLEQDGNLGPGTVKAMQKHYGTTQDGIISPVSNMVKAMQKALNKGKF